uniref:TLC domain-containing protein n=1 Tax=Kalanchoe fedtschenkoi TaxID=63787 RepID=A0A7N0VI71_KALFE
MEIMTSAYSLPLFLSGFVSVYIFAYFVVFRRWSPKIRPDAASCAISIAHGTPAVLLAAHALMSHTSTGGQSFGGRNSETDNMVLDFSIAYFVVDLGHLLVFAPADVLFIGHHVATTYVFATCRYLVGYSASAILKLLIIAEITSGVQNLWTLAAARKAEVAAAEKLYRMVSPLFYVAYTVARGVVGPVVIWEMGAFYWRSGGGGGVIPAWVWGSWMAVIVAAVVVSQLWILNLWLVWLGERRSFHKIQKKLKLSDD